MNRPAWGVMFFGQPLRALAVYIASALAVVGWYNGHVVWWLALVSVFAAAKARGAVRQRRSYLLWQAAWQEMGGEVRPKPRRDWRGRIAALLILASGFAIVAIPVSVPRGQRESDLQAYLWILACVVFISVIIALLRNALAGRSWRLPALRRRQKVAANADDGMVAWLLPAASSAPSRAMAQRNLPEYCVAVMVGGRASPEGIPQEAAF